nr:ABC transporter substrate-binding protein [uncultured Caproiciproducens sp.]
MTHHSRYLKFISIALVLSLAFGLCSCSLGQQTSSETVSSSSRSTPAKSSSDTINIGVLLPMSGTQQKAGREVKEAMNMFVDIINNERNDIDIPLAKTAGLPNLGGKKIQLVYGDLKTADTALSEAERLITSEGAVAICGLFSSATTKTAAVSTEKYKVPLVSEGTSPTLTQKGYKYFFRVFPDDTKYVDDTYQYLLQLNKQKNANIKTVAFLSEDTEFGKNIANVEVKDAEKYGFKTVENIRYSSNATNVISESLKLKRANPDVVMMSSYISDVILYIKTFKQLDYMPKMIMGQRGGFMTSELFTALGADAEGLYSTSAWSLDLDLPLVKQLSNLYTQKYSGGVELIADVLKCATDAYVLCLAINQAGSTDADAIKKAMQNLQYPVKSLFTAGTGYRFDQYGQNVAGTSLICQIKDGTYRTVYPDDLKSYDGVFPIPSWDDRKNNGN